jgi:class 3 adenylate cyclase
MSEGANEKGEEIYKSKYIKMFGNYENKIREMSIIKELLDTMRLKGIEDKTSLFREQLKIVKKYSALELITLMLLNEKLQKLEFVADSDEDKPTAKTIQFGMDDGKAEQAVFEKRPVISDIDVQHPSGQEDRIYGKSLLHIPVMHNNNAIGVLNLVHDSRNAFDQNKVSFFCLVADLIATSIVLSRLYTQMIKEENNRFLLSRFFSRNVTEKILAKNSIIRLGGERKLATIVFIDLENFTSISERLDQEKVMEILNAFFSCMTPVIFNNDGTLDKLLGDGMMAIFGAPVSREDDPVRAIHTVIEMIHVLHHFNEENRQREWPELKISVGVNTGEVVAGYIGSKDHLNYTVIGDAVNVAKRLQSLAKGDEIFISRSVKEAIEFKIGEVEGLKRLTPLPAQFVKGKKEAIDIFRVEY